MKTFKIPHIFSVIFFLMLFMAVLTYILPAGEYKKDVNGNVITGSYTKVESNSQNVLDVLKAVPIGIQNAADVIAYVLIVGGVFGVLNKTGAINAGLNALIRRFKNSDLILIPLIMIIFSIGGTVMGTSEETIPFYLIVVPLFVRLGYDPIVGIATVFLGAATGVMASTINPFSTGIASSFAGLSMQEGINTRFLYYILSVFLSVSYVVFYARWVKKDIKRSFTYKSINKKDMNYETLNHDVTFTNMHKITLMFFVAMVFIMVYGLLYKDWYMNELAMVFLGFGIVIGFVNRVRQKEFCENFLDGARDLLMIAIVIGSARGIIIIAKDGKILDTILNYIAVSLEDVSKYSFVIMHQFFSQIVGFFIPSSSGHAALSVPILAPVFGLVGIDKSVSVTSFQIASGIMNMITPTNGVLVAALSVAKVGFDSWFKFFLPLYILHMILIVIFLIFLVN
jgi:uncharacterized ion transporter superfamily protein YfcC